MIYRVWDPDSSDEDGARATEADSSSDAARTFAERYDRDDWRDGERRTCHVRKDSGEVWAVEVTGTLTWSLMASAPKRVEDES